MPNQFGNPDSCTVKNVWLLNLIPFAGLGFFYGVGPKSLGWLLGFWIYELATGVHNFAQYVPLYFLLSIIGTVALLHRQGKFNSMNTQELSTYQADHNLTVDAVGQKLGPSTHLAEESEFALSTLEQKAKKAEQMLHKMNDDGDSKYASELFEHKLSAAEKQMQARAQAEETENPNAALTGSAQNTVHSSAPNMVPLVFPSLQSAGPTASMEFNSGDDAATIQLGIGADAAATAAQAPIITLNADEDARMIQMGVGTDSAAASTLTVPGADALDFSPHPNRASAGVSPASNPGSAGLSPASSLSSLDPFPANTSANDPFGASQSGADPFVDRSNSNGTQSVDPFADEGNNADDPFLADSPNSLNASALSTGVPPAKKTGDRGSDASLKSSQSTVSYLDKVLDDGDKSDPFAGDAFGEPEADKTDAFAGDAFDAAQPDKTDPFASDAFDAAQADKTDAVADSPEPFQDNDKSDHFAAEAGLSDPFPDQSKPEVIKNVGAMPAQVAQLTDRPADKDAAPPVVPKAVKDLVPPIVPAASAAPAPPVATAASTEPLPANAETPASADIFANPFGSFDPGYGAAPSTFVLPSFNFSFDSPSTSAPSAAASTPGEKIVCPSCGKDKDVNFSFCLSCGHNYT